MVEVADTLLPDLIEALENTRYPTETTQKLVAAFKYRLTANQIGDQMREPQCYLTERREELKQYQGPTRQTGVPGRWFMAQRHIKQRFEEIK